MNRRNDDVEELLALAREAVHYEQYPEAVMHLRQAHALAPLRQDIRQLLATILEHTSVEVAHAQPEDVPDAASDPEDLLEPEFDEPEPQMPAPAPARREAAAETPRPDFRPSAFMGRDAGRWQPSATTVYEDEEEEYDEQPLPEPPSAAPVRSHVAPARLPLRPAIARQRDREQEDEAFDAAPRKGILKQFAFRIARKAAAAAEEIPTTVRRVAKSQAPPVPEEEHDDGVFRLYSELAARNPRREEESDQLETTTSLRRKAKEDTEMNGSGGEVLDHERIRRNRMIALAAAYGLMLLFFAVSSGVSYVRFFREPKPLIAKTKAAPKKNEAKSEKKTSRAQEEVVRLAQDYVNRGRLDDAIALLEPAAKAGKTEQHPKIVNLLATAFDQKGTKLLESNELERAVECYQKASDLQPDKADYGVHLGNAYYYCGTLLSADKSPKYLKSAAESLTRAIELDRNNVPAYQRLATVYEGLKQNKQARAAWIKIREIAPQSSEAELAQERLKTLSMAE